MRRRQCQRYTKRLETTFSSGGLSFKGISSDLSAGGLFIRTQHGFVPGTIIDVDIYLPNNRVAHLKGIVRRTVKTTMPGVKNGMGIELIERDKNYLEFLGTVVNKVEETQKGSEASWNINTEERSEGRPEGSCADEEDYKVRDEGKRNTDEVKEDRPLEFVLVTCDNCKVKNRVPLDRIRASQKISDFLGTAGRSGLKCGKCGTPLKIGESG